MPSRADVRWVMTGNGATCAGRPSTDDHGGRSSTVKSCMDRCEREPDCVAIDYYPEQRQCRLSGTACAAPAAYTGGSSYKLQLKSNMLWPLTKHLCDRAPQLLRNVRKSVQAELAELWPYVMKETNGNFTFSEYYVALQPQGAAMREGVRGFQLVPHEDSVDFPGPLVGVVPRACGLDGFYAFVSPQAHCHWPHVSWNCGAWQVSDNKWCLSSPNYPDNYRKNIKCQGSLRGFVDIDAAAFKTESDIDILHVNGISYSGSTGPHHQSLDPNNITSITWTSDYTVTSSGWEICATPWRRSLPNASQRVNNVLSDAPGFCRVPLQNGHHDDAIACLKTLLMLFCDRLQVPDPFPKEWFPCSYQFMFVDVDVNASLALDVHQGTSDLNMLVIKGETWKVVVG
ncbi:unnamed protein product [Prorocentrum cordatum]|uniref:Apple domain-containing protein n=1 Tax=Prorocentrum cordatum TaxID=2364126 RepID=A0ABN9UVF5_9DINO|nr:unnamed protein product [Polarella glacialis]